MKLPDKVIDANVILRFFIQDDEEQFRKTKPFVKIELEEDIDVLIVSQRLYGC
jgi:hypothetical protein